MAILWRKVVKGDVYEVRSAGNSRRLYSNGVYHSHYNPSHALSHSVWDLLMLPVLFQPRGSVKRVLLMGVGGGTVIKLLKRYINPERIIGVEINPLHLTVAKKYFNITPQDAELVCADAIEWIKNYQGPAFDLIIDDMFGHVQGEIYRAVNLDAKWMALLNRNLSKDGVLVINTTEPATIKQSAYFTNKRISNMFAVLYRMKHPGCDNYIAAFFKSHRSKRDLHANVNAEPRLALKNALLNMDYKLEKLS